MMDFDNTEKYKYIPSENEPWYKYMGFSLNKYRDNLNHQLTRALFQETANPKYMPIFTIQEFDRNVQIGGQQIRLYSLYNLYISQEDPQERLFAESIFGSWNHWLKIRQSEPIKSCIVTWQEDLEARMRSIGIQKMSDKASTGDTKAASWMAEKAFNKIYIPQKKQERRASHAKQLQQEKEEFQNILSDIENRAVDLKKLN